MKTLSELQGSILHPLDYKSHVVPTDLPLQPVSAQTAVNADTAVNGPHCKKFVKNM